MMIITTQYHKGQKLWRWDGFRAVPITIELFMYSPWLNTEHKHRRYRAHEFKNEELYTSEPFDIYIGWLSVRELHPTERACEVAQKRRNK